MWFAKSGGFSVRACGVSFLGVAISACPAAFMLFQPRSFWRCCSAVSTLQAPPFLVCLVTGGYFLRLPCARLSVIFVISVGAVVAALCVVFLFSQESCFIMASMEVPAPKPEVKPPFDSRSDPECPALFVAPKRSFAQIVNQMNAFSKIDIPIKPLAFMDAGETAVFFSSEEIEASCRLFLYPLLLNILVLGRVFQRSSIFYPLDFNSNLSFLFSFWMPDTFFSDLMRQIFC